MEGDERMTCMEDPVRTIAKYEVRPRFPIDSEPQQVGVAVFEGDSVRRFSLGRRRFGDEPTSNLAGLEELLRLPIWNLPSTRESFEFGYLHGLITTVYSPLNDEDLAFIQENVAKGTR